MERTTDKLPKEFKGKYVSRASFAKMQADRNRLKKDIYTMVMGSMPDVILLKQKYRKEFQLWEDINEGLREIAKKELPLLLKKYQSKKQTNG